MEQLIYYQGDDIPVQIELFEDDDQIIPVNIDSLSDLIIYIYTDGVEIVKASKTTKTDFITLSKKTSFIYYFIIPSEKTKLLSPGFMQIEVNSVNGGAINTIGIAHLGCLNKSLIKKES